MLIDLKNGIDFSLTGINNIEESTKADVEKALNSLKDKLKVLQLKEDEFNRNAAMVPESDPNVAAINDKIQNLKDSVQKISSDRAYLQSELKKIMDDRTNQFIAFFEQVAK